MERFVYGFSVLALLSCGLRPAKASFEVTYTLNDTVNGVSATALFQAVAGGIEITVTNTEANTLDAGHAISQIQFTFGGTLGRPTDFTRLMGTTTDFASPPAPVDVTSPGATEHWAYDSPFGGPVSLWTVDGNGLNGYGGQPDHMIVAAGSTPNDSLTNNHTPSFIGPVHFFLADSQVPASGLTANEITGVRFSFGTGPEVNLEAAILSAPEPGGLTLAGMGVATLLARAWRRKRSAVGAATA